MDIKIKDIINICNGSLIFGDLEIICENFSKDTRTIMQDDVYVGIKGENFDGNTLYKEALQKGAKVCILQDVEIDEQVKNEFSDRAVIMVENTIKALQQIAEYKRSLYNIPVIAITGSVGKTSTKDIIASVVGTKYNVLKTQGNLNNHIGLPITILNLKNHDALVVEMGMNNLGEISTLTKIAKPNIAVITNVGTSHIGNLGSRENILRAKLEIIDGLAENGTLIINNDNDMLNTWFKEYNKYKIAIEKSEQYIDTYNFAQCYLKKINIITYGIENESMFTAKQVEMKENSSKYKIEINNNLEEMEVLVGGIHFVYNAICATIAGNLINIPVKEIKKGILEFQLSKSRMEIINLLNDNLLINDCYNANYDSMKAAINYLGKINCNRKIAVLGDMLELGDFSEELHKKVAEEILNNNIDVVITVGKFAQIISKTVAVNKNIQVYHCENNKAAINKIKEIIKIKDAILVKASNGMKFKEIVDEMCKK